MMAVRRSCFKLAVALLCFHRAASVPFAGFNSNRFYQPSITEPNRRFVSNNENEESNFRKYASAGAHLKPAVNRDYAAAVPNVHAGATKNFQQDATSIWNPTPKRVNSNNYIAESSFQQPHIDLASQHAKAKISLNSQETFGNFQNYAQVHNNAENFLKPAFHRDYATAAANVHARATENFEQDLSSFSNPRLKHVNSNNYIAESSFQQPNVNLASQQAKVKISQNSHETFGNLESYAQAHHNAENILKPAVNRNYATTVANLQADTTGNFKQDRSSIWNPQLKHVNSNNYIGESLIQEPHVDFARQHAEAQISLNSHETFNNLPNYPQAEINAENTVHDFGNFDTKEQFFQKPQRHYFNPNLVRSFQTNKVIAHYPVNTPTVVDEDYTSPSTYHPKEIIRHNYPGTDQFEARILVHENFQLPTVPHSHRQPVQEQLTNLGENEFPWKHSIHVVPDNTISIPNDKKKVLYRYRLIYPNGTVVYTNYTDLIPHQVPTPGASPELPFSSPKLTPPVLQPHNHGSSFDNPTTVIIANPKPDTPPHIPTPPVPHSNNPKVPSMKQTNVFTVSPKPANLVHRPTTPDPHPNNPKGSSVNQTNVIIVSPKLANPEHRPTPPVPHPNNPKGPSVNQTNVIILSPKPANPEHRPTPPVPHPNNPKGPSVNQTNVVIVSTKPENPEHRPTPPLPHPNNPKGPSVNQTNVVIVSTKPVHPAHIPTPPVPHPNNPKGPSVNQTNVIILNTTSPHPTNLNKTTPNEQHKTDKKHHRHHRSHRKTVIRHLVTYPNGTTVEKVFTTVVDNGVPRTNTIHIVTDKNKPPVVVLNTTHVGKPERPKTPGSPDSQQTTVVHTFVYPNGTAVDDIIDTIIEGNKPPKVNRSRIIHTAHTNNTSTGPLDKYVRAIDNLVGLNDPKNPTKPSNDSQKNNTKPNDPKTPGNKTDPPKNQTAPNVPKIPVNETKPDDPKTPANKTDPPKNGTKPSDPKTPANETKPNDSPKNNTKPDDPKKPSNKTDTPKNETAPNDPKPLVNGTKPDDTKIPANKTDPPKNGTNPSDPKTPANETKPANDSPKNDTKPDDPKTPVNKTSPSPDPNKNDTKPNDPKKPANETKPPTDPGKNDTKPEKPPVKHHRLVIETHHIIHFRRNRTLTDKIRRTEKLDDNAPVVTTDVYSGEDDEDVNDLQEGTNTDVTHGIVTSPTGTKSKVTSTVTQTVIKHPNGNADEFVNLKDDIQDI